MEFGIIFLACFVIGLAVRAYLMSATTACPEKYWGVMITIGGMLACGYFMMFFDNTVSSDIGRVHNSGQMQFQMMGFVGGLAMILAGVLMSIFAKPRVVK